MKNKIYLASPHMSEEGYELEYVKEAFETNWIAPIGPNVDKFEKELALYVGIKYSTALVSGTAAIHMALKASGVTEGDIVICQSLTFAATANPIIYEKAIPVFVDSDYSTWNMSPKYLEQALQKYPNAKAVIVVHLYGLPADIDKINEICTKYKVPLIEDAAESLGSIYKGKQTGTIGRFGIFSFNGNKIITTSGGGMLVSNNKEKIQKVKFWATQARDQARHYQHSELGYNYRMSNIVAGIGRGQLKVLNKRIQQKTTIYNYYKENLKEINIISFMPENMFCVPNYWLSCILLESSFIATKILEALEQENIEARPVWKPMHLQPYYSNHDFLGEDISEKIYKKGICLPSDTKLDEYDLERIVKIIKEVIENEK
jgi:dTDP-4-amino-4,6-dideoxygalactose transaminase